VSITLAWRTWPDGVISRSLFAVVSAQRSALEGETRVVFVARAADTRAARG
jgi:hypothetical protein